MSTTKLFNKPVLFIVFNRLEPTKQVFARIREIKPRQLFIAADGPRANNEQDQIKCYQVRDYLMTNIDWDCQVKTLFREENLGCALNCTKAIDWFFDQVEEGIIIEDDRLPELSFFPFCAELLDRYRNQEQIMHIGGVNYGEPFLEQYSYYFSQIAYVGAWATWRQAWQKYDLLMSSWPLFIQEQQINNVFPKKITGQAWNWSFDLHYQEKNKSGWDYQWFYAIFAHRGLVINPRVNLVTHIGLDSDATHQVDIKSPVHVQKSQAMDFPLSHPVFMLPSAHSQDWLNNNVYGANYRVFGVKQVLRRLGLFNLVKRVFYFITGR